MAVTPRGKAIAFASILLLVSTALVVSAAASTNSALAPFISGKEFPKERSLTRGQHVALGVRVGEVVDGEIQPIPGALVSVFRPGDGDDNESTGSNRSVASASTGENGAAVFQIKPGRYILEVVAGDKNASYRLQLSQSSRIQMYFDEDGAAHWEEGSHEAMERRGDFAQLSVRVGTENADGSMSPAEGAIVEVYRWERGERVLVQNKTTGPRGFAEFLVHKGRFSINVTFGNATSTKDVAVQGPTAVAVVFDGDDGQWVKRQPTEKKAERPENTRATDRGRSGNVR